MNKNNYRKISIKMLPLFIMFTGILLVTFILITSQLGQPKKVNCKDNTIIHGVNYTYCLTPLDNKVTTNSEVK